MAELQERVVHLSQDIDPHPAGSEAEQQAAFYIAEKLKKEADLSPSVEEFNFRTNYDLMRTIYCAVAVIMGLLTVFVPASLLLSFILTAIAAILYVLDVFGIFSFGRFLRLGISQNVVAKYEPITERYAAGTRRRKVVFVARYDSDKVEHGLTSAVLSMLPTLRWVELAAIILIPIFLLLRLVLGLAEAPLVVINILLVVCVIIVLLPIISFLLRFASSYSEGANCNAAGVSVMLEVATRIGQDSLYGGRAEGEFVDGMQRAVAEGSAGNMQNIQGSAVIHGEAEARRQGLVPEGADLVYETGYAGSEVDDMKDASPEERLAAAKAAIAALSGKAVSEKINIDSSDKELTAEEPNITTTQAAFDTQEASATNAVSFTQPPTDFDTSGVSSKISGMPDEGFSIHDQTDFSKQAAPYEQSINEQPTEQLTQQPTQQPTQQSAQVNVVEFDSPTADTSFEKDSAEAVFDANAQAAVPAESPLNVPVDTPADMFDFSSDGFSDTAAQKDVPAWYKTAQEKARKPVGENAPAQRSHYADALDSAVLESSSYFKQANDAISSETESRLQHMRDSIMEVKPPSFDDINREMMATDDENKVIAAADENKEVSLEEAVLPEDFEAKIENEVVNEQELPFESVSAQVAEYVPVEGVEKTEMSEEARSVYEAIKKQISAEQMPEEQISVEQVPIEQASAEEVLEEQVPVEQEPIEQISTEQVFKEQVPEEEIFTEEIPDEQIFEEKVSAEQIPEEQISVEQVPIEQASAEQVLEEQMPEEQISAEEVLEEQIPEGESFTEEVPDEQVFEEQASAEQVLEEQIPEEQIPEEESSVERISFDLTEDSLSEASSVQETAKKAPWIPSLVFDDEQEADQKEQGEQISEEIDIDTDLYDLEGRLRDDDIAFESQGSEDDTIDVFDDERLIGDESVSPDRSSVVDVDRTISFIPVAIDEEQLRQELLAQNRGENVDEIDESVVSSVEPQPEEEAEEEYETESEFDKDDVHSYVTYTAVDVEDQEQSAVEQDSSAVEVEEEDEPQEQKSSNQGFVVPKVISQSGNEESQGSAKATKRRRRSIDLPGLTNEFAPVSTLDEDLKQPAPLGDDALLSHSRSQKLKKLSFDEEGTGSAASSRDEFLARQAALRSSLPSVSGSITFEESRAQITNLTDSDAADEEETSSETSANVSQAGSFASVGATGVFDPVGGELVEDIAPEEVYVDDADDSDYGDQITETGAFAGPGYVDMPKSRIARFFGRFRRSNNKSQDTETPQEWLEVDEDFEAREVGKARGDWDSFRDDDLNESEVVSDVDVSVSEPENVDLGETLSEDISDHNDEELLDKIDAETIDINEDDVDETNADEISMDEENIDDAPIDYIDIESVDNSTDDIDDTSDESDLWNGGGSSRRSREEETRSPSEKTPSSSEGNAETQSENRIDNNVEDMQRIRQFRRATVNTEVWFVALGSDLANNSGMKAFLAEHADELKGSLIIELEGLGAGDLSLIEKEGMYRAAKSSSRGRRYLRKATSALGINLGSGSMRWKETAAACAARRGYQSMHFAGMEKGKPAYYGEADDIADNVSEQTMFTNAEFIIEFLKNA